MGRGGGVNAQILPVQNMKNKQKADGTYNVKIRMTHNREVEKTIYQYFCKTLRPHQIIQTKETPAYQRSGCLSKAVSGDMCWSSPGSLQLWH